MRSFERESRSIVITKELVKRNKKTDNGETVRKKSKSVYPWKRGENLVLSRISRYDRAFQKVKQTSKGGRWVNRLGRFHETTTSQSVWFFYGKTVCRDYRMKSLSGNYSGIRLDVFVTWAPSANDCLFRSNSSYSFLDTSVTLFTRENDEYVAAVMVSYLFSTDGLSRSYAFDFRQAPYFSLSVIW